MRPESSDPRAFGCGEVETELSVCQRLSLMRARTGSGTSSPEKHTRSDRIPNALQFEPFVRLMRMPVGMSAKPVRRNRRRIPLRWNQRTLKRSLDLVGRKPRSDHFCRCDVGDGDPDCGDVKRFGDFPSKPRGLQRTCFQNLEVPHHANSRRWPNDRAGRGT